MLNNIKSTQGTWALCRRQASKMQYMRDTKCRVVELSVNVGKMGFAHLPLYNIKTKGAV